MRRARRGDGLERDEAADAVIGMDHEIAGLERLHLQDDVLRALGFALLAHQPVAQDVALGHHREPVEGEADSSPQTATATSVPRLSALTAAKVLITVGFLSPWSVSTPQSRSREPSDQDPRIT